MTSLNIIEQFLNIQIGNKRLMKGKNQETKNQYYYYKNLYYIVSLQNEKWVIMTTNNQTRDLLTNHKWRNNEGYAQTDINDSTKKLHRILLNCPANMEVDHINIKNWDNRISNLRIATRQEQNRNKSIIITNTSGITGVSKTNRKNDINDWVAFINDNQGNKLRKSFACKKYGDNEAKQMAINQRLIWKQQYNYLGE